MSTKLTIHAEKLDDGVTCWHYLLAHPECGMSRVVRLSGLNNVIYAAGHSCEQGWVDICFAADIEACVRLAACILFEANVTITTESTS